MSRTLILAASAYVFLLGINGLHGDVPPPAAPNAGAETIVYTPPNAGVPPNQTTVNVEVEVNPNGGYYYGGYPNYPYYPYGGYYYGHPYYHGYYYGHPYNHGGWNGHHHR